MKNLLLLAALLLSGCASTVSVSRIEFFCAPIDNGMLDCADQQTWKDWAEKQKAAKTGLEF